MTAPGDQPAMVDALEQSLQADATEGVARTWETFNASTLGFCSRQTYLTHLGLRDNTDWAGKFHTRRVLQDHLVDALGDLDHTLEVNPSFSISTGSVTISGQPTCHIPAHDAVYHVKPRDGWYKFSPPIDRHLRQLQVYLRGLDADQGQILYVSMADATDIRVWPDDSQDATFVKQDSSVVESVVQKAEAIRQEIVTNGIATTPEMIPYDPCGCYLCDTEDLHLPETVTDLRHEAQNSAPLSEPCSGGLDGQTPGDETDDGEFHLGNLGDDSERLLVDEYHVPSELTAHDVWVVWDTDSKLARAPWQTDTMYPCEWADAKDVDPRRNYKTARMVAELPVERIDDSWPFPEDLPETIKPAVLLPHAPPDPPITFVDFDDVRDPDTGQTSREVVGLLEELGGYTEVSTSGRGLHAYVRAQLPDRQFQAPLRETGSVELYDHSRMTGGTWRHVEGTPADRVPNAQEAVENIVRRYR